jgi:hypothetical protein
MFGYNLGQWADLRDEARAYALILIRYSSIASESSQQALYTQSAFILCFQEKYLVQLPSFFYIFKWCEAFMTFKDYTFVRPHTHKNPL